MMEDKKFSWPIRVYYEDTDAGGVVFYGNYLKFFERARTELLRHFGFDHARLSQSERIVFVVRSVQIDYLAPARLDDLMMVTADVVKSGKASLVFEQIITRGDNVLTKSIIKIGCLNTDTMRPKAIPDFILACLKND
jgi:acyl-CoA thioester hydrolase